MQDAFHDLVPLNDEFARLGQPFRFRSFTKRAKDLGLVFKIEKALFIKQSQTHEIVESLTAYHRPMYAFPRIGPNTGSSPDENVLPPL